MDLGDHINSIQVVDCTALADFVVVSRWQGGHTARVEADLVHACDPSVLHLLLELEHCRGDVACGHDLWTSMSMRQSHIVLERRNTNVLLVADGALDDCRVECIWDKRDDQIMFCDLSVESLVVGDIEGDGCRKLYALGELLRIAKSPAG